MAKRNKIPSGIVKFEICRWTEEDGMRFMKPVLEEILLNTETEAVLCAQALGQGYCFRATVKKINDTCQNG